MRPPEIQTASTDISSRNAPASNGHSSDLGSRRKKSSRSVTVHYSDREELDMHEAPLTQNMHLSERESKELADDMRESVHVYGSPSAKKPHFPRESKELGEDVLEAEAEELSATIDELRQSMAAVHTKTGENKKLRLRYFDELVLKSLSQQKMDHHEYTKMCKVVCVCLMVLCLNICDFRPLPSRLSSLAQ